MGKIKEITINRFDGGISNDKRSKSSNKFAMARHFDTFTYPHKLVPNTGWEEKATGATDIVKFVFADRSGTQTLYGFDRTSGGKCQVKYWNGTGWVESSNNESTSGARKEEVFFEYKDGIFMWGADYLKRFDTAGGAFDDSYEDLAYGSSIAEPVLHPADDIAYFFVDNKVYSLNNVTWGGLKLTLPSNLKIVSACPYGNYLALACTTKATVAQRGSSVVFLWDRDSSITTLTERSDFGLGLIKHIETLNNNLIAVMDTPEKILVKVLNGKFATVTDELTKYSSSFTGNKQVVDNKLYFAMAPQITYLGDERRGIWSINSLGKLSLARVKSDATTFSGIYYTGDTWWTAYNSAGVARSTTSFSEDAVYESLILGEGEQNKKLISIGVMTNPLATNSNCIKLEYKTNNDSAFTTIFGGTGGNNRARFATYHEAINIESDGSPLPQFHEIEIKITISKQSVDLTGLKLVYEEIDSGLN